MDLAPVGSVYGEDLHQHALAGLELERGIYAALVTQFADRNVPDVS